MGERQIMKTDTCHYCGGTLEPGLTTFTVVKYEAVYLVRDVPCLECTICEEAIFSDETAEQLSRYTSGRILPTRRQLTAYVYHLADPVMEIPETAPVVETHNSVSVPAGATKADPYLVG